MKWLQLIMQFFPVVLQTVVAIESAVKNMPASSTPVSGVVKKTIAMDVITAGAQSAGQPIPADHLASIGTLIDNIVTSLNKNGVFAKADIETGKGLLPTS